MLQLDIIFIQDELYAIKFDVESTISNSSVTSLRQMLNTTNKICTYHMQANAYKHHLIKHLFSNNAKLSVKIGLPLLVNLQIMSKTLQELQVRRQQVYNSNVLLYIMDRLLLQILQKHVWSLQLRSTGRFMSC